MSLDEALTRAPDPEWAARGLTRGSVEYAPRIQYSMEKSPDREQYGFWQKVVYAGALKV